MTKIERSYSHKEKLPSLFQFYALKKKYAPLLHTTASATKKPSVTSDSVTIPPLYRLKSANGSGDVITDVGPLSPNPRTKPTYDHQY